MLSEIGRWAGDEGRGGGWSEGMKGSSEGMDNIARLILGLEGG